jgi:hypothetical protein
MKLHANARTCPHSHRLAVVRLEQQGWTLTDATSHPRRDLGSVASSPWAVVSANVAIDPRTLSPRIET